MKKLKLQMQTSVDGFVGDDKERTDWLVWNWGPEWTWDEALRKHFISSTIRWIRYYSAGKWRRKASLVIGPG